MNILEMIWHFNPIMATAHIIARSIEADKASCDAVISRAIGWNPDENQEHPEGYQQGESYHGENTYYRVVRPAREVKAAIKEKLPQQVRVTKYEMERE